MTHVPDGDGGVTDITPTELRLQLAGIAPFEVVLGLPGESKNTITRRGGHLRNIWYEAEKALADADEVVFIGYSLPPEDVQAMELIVDSIRARTKPDPLPVKLVLGPGEKEARVISAILSGTARPENQGFYTQHALNTWHRDP